MKMRILPLFIFCAWNTPISCSHDVSESSESISNPKKTLSIYNADTGVAYSVGNAINILGGSNIATFGAESTLSINLDVTSSLNPATESASSPTSSVTTTGRVVVATFTGFTTAINNTQTFTINNSAILSTSGMLVTVTNLNGSGNNALMQVVGITQAPGSIVITTTNAGSGALADDVLITVWIIS